MDTVSRGSDGRRLFTAEFKRAQIDRILKGGELERALGRATMENEILRAARDEVKKRPRWYGVSEKRPAERSR